MASLGMDGFMGQAIEEAESVDPQVILLLLLPPLLFEYAMDIGQLIMFMLLVLRGFLTSCGWLGLSLFACLLYRLAYFHASLLAIFPAGYSWRVHSNRFVR